MTRTATRRDAEAAFNAGDTVAAYRAYIELWHTHHDLDDLVSAARSLERAQQWRAIIAIWEEVARTISDGPHGVGARAGDRLFNQLQKRADHWTNPPGADHPGYYKGHKEKANRHRRAWALQWAAEEASAAQRHELAARLHRAAAFAWTTTSWGDKNTSEWARCPHCSPSPSGVTRILVSGRAQGYPQCEAPESRQAPQDCRGHGGTLRSSPSERREQSQGEKWELAACSFFYSIMEGIESKLRDRKDPIEEVYRLTGEDAKVLRGLSAAPKEVPAWLRIRALRQNRLLRRYAIVRGDPANGLSDIERLILCYMKWAEVQYDDTRPSVHGEISRRERVAVKRVALKKAYDALGAIEGALTRVGRRGDARRVHITRQKLLRDSKRWHPALILLYPKWIFGDGARSWVPFAWAAFFWLGVFPAIFARFQLVHHSGPSHRLASPVNAVIFSLGNALTISVGDLQTRGWEGGIVQICDTAVLYALFGVVLYTLTRSFEE